ncbi:hypothetical protein [Rhodoferax aquaticus]|uniref:hypothetical protein n=1 Tax=Rhodoferax aquaticus TaxID=2527691 RepID=UPI003CCA491D
MADPKQVKKEADAKAIGGACRYGMRSLEDCYTLNDKASKSAIFIGWKDMDQYMRENKVEGIEAKIPRPPPPPPPPKPGEETVVEEEKASATEAPAPAPAKTPEKAGEKVAATGKEKASDTKAKPSAKPKATAAGGEH